MPECIINGKNRYFLAKNLTSYTDISLLIKKYTINGMWCTWSKEFSFGGDKLEIETSFFVPSKLSLFKSNPIYHKIKRGWKFSKYKEEFGQDKEWLDYMRYVAKETNTEKELEETISKSKEIVDLLNQWSEEGKL